MKRGIKIFSIFIITTMLLATASFIHAEERSSLEGKNTLKVEELPVVGSYERLKKLLAEIQENTPYSLYKGRAVMAMDESAVMKEKASESMKADSGAVTGDSDFSSTNVQVQGVDEADIVKTDGQYIYQVNNGRIVVAKAYPAESMKVASVLGFTDGNFMPQELYLYGKYLMVIGSTHRDIPLYETRTEKKAEIMPVPRYTNPTTKVLIYDATDKNNLKLVREVETDGTYLSSRKVGSFLYFLSNRYIHVYYIEKQADDQALLPGYRDTAEGSEFVKVNYDKIRYFPDCTEPSYLVTAGLDLERMDEAVSISTYLGAGQNVYASQKNLYVALTNDKVYKKQKVDDKTFAAEGYPVDKRNTMVYKFALDGVKMAYSGKSEVPGTILNQFSMDEDKGTFRIATTKGDIWRNDENTSKNNLYILDEKLNITGKIEDIAPGERIYSVRFMGDRAYMVTFKKVDPLFVLDLKDAKNPKILGALKIPGYSDYLHPYDENHIIGFGKDAVEEKGMAYYQGMKIAMFDVTDVAKPKEMFVEKIGDRGTDSEILRDHKALLFHKEKNLLAFPVTLAEVKTSDAGQKLKSSMEYGQFTFQGAYIYHIDLTGGFKLQGRITHISDQDYLKSGDGWYDSNRNVERILYINDTLYTLSKGMFKANRMDDLKERNTLLIP